MVKNLIYILCTLSLTFLVSCNPLGGSNQGSRVDDGYFPTLGLGVADHLEIISGNNQSGITSTPLAQPLVARVVDVTGAGIANIILNITVETGAGSVSVSSATTDINGKISFNWTLGGASAVQTVKISSFGLIMGNPSTLIFTANNLSSPVSATNSTITGTSPVVADGMSLSTVTIHLKDTNNQAVIGTTPIFTSSGSNNTYSTCSVSDSSGVSTCTMKSTKAETKTLQLTSPVIKTGSTVTFNPGSANAANSTVTATTPVVANGINTSTITITLLDAYNNGVQKSTPVLAVGGTNNTISSCSSTNSSGISTCTVSSTKAETKSIQLTSPFVKNGGSVVFVADTVSSTRSTISGTSNITANGTSPSIVTINLLDDYNNPIIGVIPTFTATGTNNSYEICSATDAAGNSICNFKSIKAETKTLSITSPITKTGSTVTFVAGTTSVTNSIVSATTNIVANGSSVSTVTITLLDAENNPVSGTVPTINVSGTNNTLSACSSTDSLGVSTCTISSTKAETKSLQMTSPITKSGNSIVFVADNASLANSSISGTSNITANNSSTITITLLDGQNNPIVGTVPTFSASGSNNIYGTCSATNSSGISVCLLTSTKAETKSLQMTSPITKSGNSIIFIPAVASSIVITAGNSQTAARGSVLANAFEVQLKDAYDNVISGQAITWSITAGNGTLSSTSNSTDSNGKSTSTLTLGTSPGVNTVTATALPSLTATFNATGNLSSLSNNIWNFKTTEATNYVLSDSTLEFTTSSVRLKMPDQVDQDGSVKGFGGGSFSGAAAWDNSNQRVYLNASASCTTTNTCSELNSSWTPNWNKLLGYWKLNDSSGATTVADSKGSFSGTANAVTFNSTGLIGTSAGFNGSSSYIDLGAPSDLNMGLQNWSVQAWAQMSSTASILPIISKSKPTGQVGRCF